MRKLAVALASSLLLAVPAAAPAQSGVEPFLKATPSGPPESGLSVGLRLAYGLPFGGVSGAAGDDLSNFFSGSFPIQLDLGWRFNPHWYLGGYFQYGFLFIATSSPVTTACSAGASCSGTDMRFGVDLVYTFLPYGTITPWVGVGAGYEITKLSASSAGQSIDFTFSGWEFGHVSLGLDFRLAPSFRIGPFATITFGQYQSVDSPYNINTGQLGATQSYDISQKALHEWLQLGMKATLDF